MRSEAQYDGDRPDTVPDAVAAAGPRAISDIGQGVEQAVAEPLVLGGVIKWFDVTRGFGFAEARAVAMQRRGLGARRVAGAFREAGIAEADAEAIAPAIAERGVDAALAYAKRKRLGPFARPGAQENDDRALRQKQLGAMVRAGHSFDLARKILSSAPSDTIDATDFD